MHRITTRLGSPGLSCRLTILVGFVAVLAALSLVPGHPRPGDSAFVWAVAKIPSTLQNGAHVVAYALLTVLWAWTLTVKRARAAWIFMASAVLSMVVGAVLELCQLGVPGRYGSVSDVLLNAFGALIGVPMARWNLLSARAKDFTSG